MDNAKYLKKLTLYTVKKSRNCEILDPYNFAVKRMYQTTPNTYSSINASFNSS